MKRRRLTLLLALAIVCACALSACNNKGQDRLAEEQTLKPTAEVSAPAEETPAPAQKTVTYENFPDVPDFGAIAGIAPINTTENAYGYLVSDDNAADVERYDQALRESGFSLITTRENDDRTPILFYDNEEHTAAWGVTEKGVLLVMIEDSVIASGGEATSPEKNNSSVLSATTGEKTR